MRERGIASFSGDELAIINLVWQRLRLWPDTIDRWKTKFGGQLRSISNRRRHKSGRLEAEKRRAPQDATVQRFRVALAAIQLRDVRTQLLSNWR